MKTRAVDFVCYNVSNLENALAFYRDTLGLELDFIYEGIWAEFTVEPVALAICGPPWASAPKPDYQGGATVALAVEDVKAAVEELRGKGVPILEEPVETPVCYMAMIADLDGNRLWLHQRKDGTCG